jgi:membrane-associated phospholipid phosphatase
MMNFKKYVAINLSIAFIIGICAAVVGFNNFTLKIHNFYSFQLDRYVKNYTIWAEWPVILLGIFLMIQFNWRKGLWFSFVFGIEALIVQFIKFQLNFPRPIEKFGSTVRQIDGEVLKHFQAFPSGHTSAAFFATGMIILSLPKHKLQNLTLFLSIFSAFLIGYSRIYLGQHSIEDTIAGCMIANIFFYLAGITFPYIHKKSNPKYPF